MAAETKIIQTVTNLNVNGSDIDIYTYYNDPSTLPDTISADITEVTGIQDNTSYIEGELIIQMKNHPQHIDYIIDNNGDLILICNTGDESKYMIDGNGYLNYIN